MQEALDALTSVGPMTNRELVCLLRLSERSVAENLHRLRRNGLVRIERYEAPVGRGAWAPVYAVGSEPDAVFVRPPDAARKQRYRTKKALLPKRPATPWDALLRL